MKRNIPSEWTPDIVLEPIAPTTNPSIELCPQTKFIATYRQIVKNGNIPAKWIPNYYPVTCSIHPLPKPFLNSDRKQQNLLQYTRSRLKTSTGAYIARRELPLFSACKFFHQLASLSPIHISIQRKINPNLVFRIWCRNCSRQELLSFSGFDAETVANFTNKQKLSISSEYKPS